MSDPVIVTEDLGRVRVITIIRDALGSVETDDTVAVAIITGEGRAFSAGQDLQEMQEGLSDGEGGDHLFPGMLKQLTEFQKPLSLQ